MNAEEIRGRILEHMVECPDDWKPTQGESGALNGAITKAIDPLREHKPYERENWRHILLAWLFGGVLDTRPSVLSSKSLTPEQWYAIYRWVDWWKDEEMVWQVSEAFQTEAPILLAQALRESEERDRVILSELGFGKEAGYDR